ncbi:taste receptor type 2 member 40-like [Dendropsophus ebraccatus]|uniref:taste receptor type 2 member 40-like n=1 Tax=Dendropsophus ebraccatus TaxID=150705 RepID=UPI0038321CDD
MITNKSTNISAAERIIMQISAINMLQLISRILSIVIADQQEICYPMTPPCKVTVFLLCVARKGSMFFTIFLGMFRLLKIKNKPHFILTNTYLNLALGIIWLILTSTCFPYVVLIPANRSHYQNLTATCSCSFLHSLTDRDLGVKIFDWVFGVGSLYLVIIMMCFVSFKMVLILIKHQKTVFVNGTLHRTGTRHQEITAIKALIALLVSYITCSIFSLSYRLGSEFVVLDLHKISADVYNVLSPAILGYPYFRKLHCMSGLCHKQKQEQVLAIS